MTAREPISRGGGLLHSLRRRGVLRVAASYAVIAWLLLQIASVVLDPLGVPRWVMTALIIATAAGFPVALALAWFLEIGEHGIEIDRAAEDVPRPTAHGLRRYADAIVIGVLLMAVAVLLVRQSDLGKPKPPANPAIAVLPFENLEGDPQQEYFGEGLAQEVLDRLGRVPGLTVIARSSSFSFKGKDVDARAIAEKLGVTTLLEGSVRREGRRLKLSAELIDGASGRQIWSGSYDRALTDVFQVQEELAGEVIQAIVPAVRGEAMPKLIAPTSDMNAYDLYLLGRTAQESRIGERLGESVGYLEKAIVADPKFAKAHAALSRSLYLWTHYSAVRPPADAMARAEAEAYRALAIDLDSSEAHAALATVMRERSPSVAEAEYKRALQLNPNNVAALWDYGALLSLDPKRAKESQTLLERVERLDPRSSILWIQKLDDSLQARDGGKSFRVVFAQALAMFADDSDGLSQLAREARTLGFAPEGYRASLMNPQAKPIEAAFGSIVPWLDVDDYSRAQRAADALAQSGEGPAIAACWQIEIAGVTGDFASVTRLIDRQLKLAPDDPVWRRKAAFWLAVQGRYTEAAQQLSNGGPLSETPPGGPGLGTSLADGGQLLPAVLRIYRATGRQAEANDMAQRYLKILRSNPEAAVDLAALAANEGDKAEAVRALKSEFERVPLVFMFYPQLPWFRNLEGYVPYDQLMAERKRRVERAHAEMLQLEGRAGRSTEGSH